MRCVSCVYTVVLSISVSCGQDLTGLVHLWFLNFSGSIAPKQASRATWNTLPRTVSRVSDLLTLEAADGRGKSDCGETKTLMVIKNLIKHS